VAWASVRECSLLREYCSQSPFYITNWGGKSPYVRVSAA